MGNKSGRHQEVHELKFAGKHPPRAVTTNANGEVLVILGNSVVRVNVMLKSSLLIAGQRAVVGYAEGDAIKEALFACPTALHSVPVGISLPNNSVESSSSGQCLSNTSPTPTGPGAILICDSFNCRIRLIDKGRVETYAGNGTRSFQDGPRLQSSFMCPSSIVFCNDHWFIGDHQLLRIISPDGNVTSLTRSHDTPWTGDGLLAGDIDQYKEEWVPISPISHVSDLSRVQDLTISLTPWYDGSQSGSDKKPKAAGLFIIDYRNVRLLKLSFQDRTLSNVIQRPSSNRAVEVIEMPDDLSDSHMRTAVKWPLAVATRASTGELFVLDEPARKIFRASKRDKYQKISIAVRVDKNSPAMKPFRLGFEQNVLEDFGSADPKIQRAVSLAGHPSMHISAAGDLYWILGGPTTSLRCILGFVPPERSFLTTTIFDLVDVGDFCNLLDIGPSTSISLNQVSLKHEASSTVFNLIPSLVNASAPALINDPEVLSSVSHSPVPIESIRAFLRFLYGSSILPPATNSASLDSYQAAVELAYFVYLAYLCKIDPDTDWLRFLEWRLYEQLRILDQRSLFKIIALFSENCGAREELIDMACGALRLESFHPSLIMRSLPSKLDLVNTILLKVLGYIVVDIPSQPTAELSRLDILQSALEYASDKLFFSNGGDAFDSSIGPNFSLEIEGEYPTKVMVHDWVLYTRWPWFKELLESGMAESQTRSLSLPSEFPSTLLHSLMQFFYTNGKNYNNPSDDQWIWLLANGAQFGLVTLNGGPVPGLEALSCNAKACIIKPLTIENAVSMLKIRIMLEEDREIDQTIKFMAENLKFISRSSRLRSQLSQFLANNNLRPERVASLRIEE
jgi:hypothetical protein